MSIYKQEVYVVLGGLLEGDLRVLSFSRGMPAVQVPPEVENAPVQKEALRTWLDLDNKFQGYEGEIAVVKVLYVYNRQRTETATVTGEEDG